MLGDFTCRVVLNLIGFIWPAYACFKALEQKQSEAIREWCTYWLMLAIFTTAERMVLDWLVFWVPLYYEGKVLFVLWLWHPKTRGAEYLYQHTVQPLLSKHEATIDRHLAEMRTTVADFASVYFYKLVTLVQSKAHLAIGHLQQMQANRAAAAASSHKAD
ncbi:hypothetical protein WJX81_006350 [Elliptochloris bilobata]|uniref:HVA22-like protein n=1 Tax=Elliptochloris bilobata TaxID=381761 RepID=A0AAW1REC4_9CHLO